MTQLPQYRGALSPEHAARGIELARSNAARLLADAQLLLEAERYPSALALAILAIEELGKVQVIKTILLYNDESGLKRAWKDYRSHRAKNVQWILPTLAAEGARTLQQLRTATDAKGDHTAMLDSIKQLAFYTDCFGSSARWSEPSEAVDPKLAESIIGVAKMLSRDRVTEVRELELWVELFSPHYEKPGMIEALLRFQQGLFDEGLSDTPAETMKAFVTGEPVGLENPNFPATIGTS